MHGQSTRATGAVHQPSTSGVRAGLSPRWRVRAGIVAIVGLAVAAPVMAAEPTAPPRLAEVGEAVPATPVKAKQVDDTFHTLGKAALLVTVVSTDKAADTPPPPPPPPPPPTTTTTAPPTTTTTTAPPTTTTTTAPPTTTTAPPTTTTAPPPPPPTTRAPAPAPVAAPAPAPRSSGSGDWDRLAQCEAGGNWAINSGNGYYGGLQFSAQSWQAVGGSGLPHQASRETQIAMGERLRAAQGWGAWPSCSSKLGLR